MGRLVDLVFNRVDGGLPLWRRELDEANPIDSRGRIARGLAALLELLCAPGASAAVAPSAFKEMLGEVNAQVWRRTCSLCCALCACARAAAGQSAPPFTPGLDPILHGA